MSECKVFLFDDQYEPFVDYFKAKAKKPEIKIIPYEYKMNISLREQLKEALEMALKENFDLLLLDNLFGDAWADEIIAEDKAIQELLKNVSEKTEVVVFTRQHTEMRNFNKVIEGVTGKPPKVINKEQPAEGAWMNEIIEICEEKGEK